ncbi:MAG: SEL1-like repeat protein [Synergistaceae bacterium]|nr:SEL1-like repeat protein [Synergistaceae bacterium]
MSKHYKRAILLLVILAVTFSANTLFAAARRRVPVKPRMQNSHKIEQLRREADRGHVGSQFELGRIYYNGDGVKRDYKQAYYWYDKAANKGDANAQYRLAELFYSGHGTKQNYYNAAYWFRKACISNHRNDSVKDSAFQRGMDEFKAKNYKRAADLFKAAWSRPAAKPAPAAPRPTPKPAPAPVAKPEISRPTHNAPTPAPVNKPESPKVENKPAPVARPEPPKPAPAPVAKPEISKPTHNAPTPAPVNKPEPPKPSMHNPSSTVEHHSPRAPEKPRIPDNPEHRRPE